VKDRTRQAALRIALLLEEFSDVELADGVALLGGKTGDDLLSFLTTNSTAVSRRNPERGVKRRPSQGAHSVAALRSSNPAKFELLRQFESRLRDGTILESLESVRAFGKSIRKDFDAGKSRKDAVSHVIALLAEMETDVVRSIVDQANVPRSSGGAFQRLADQIIRGRSGGPAVGSGHETPESSALGPERDQGEETPSRVR